MIIMSYISKSRIRSVNKVVPMGKKFIYMKILKNAQRNTGGQNIIVIILHLFRTKIIKILSIIAQMKT